MQPRSKRIKVASEPPAILKGVKEPDLDVPNGREAPCDLLEMPMEIICEVLYLLLPLDLLRVTRINKAFRNLLMHRSSLHIWKKARKNISGLPEPFSDMSEPAFASLCFEIVCHGCFEPRMQNILWEFRMKLCNECLKAKTSESHVLTVHDHNNRYCILPHVSVKPTIPGHRYCNGLVLKSEATRIKETWKELKTQNARETFIRENKARVQVLEKHVEKYRAWFLAFETEREKQLGIIRKQRYQDIHKKLEQIGYGDDIVWAKDHDDKYSSVAHIHEAKPLTPQGWNDIRNNIIEYIEGHIIPKRTRDENVAFYSLCMPFVHKARIAFARSYGNVFPLTGCFGSLPEVQAIVDSLDGLEISIESFDPLIPVLPRILADWRTSVEKTLDMYLRQHLDLPVDSCVRNLAIAEFLLCEDCHRIIPTSGLTPAIHNCRESNKAFQRNNGRCLPEDYFTITLIKMGMKTWSPENYTILSDYVKPILKACDMAISTTVQELDQLDPRLVCKSGCDESDTRTIYRWRDAVIHSIHTHKTLVDYWYRGHGIDRIRWEVLSSREAKKLESVEQAADEYAITQKNKQHVWGCRHCNKSGLHRDGIVRHIKDKHGMQNPDDSSFFSEPDTPATIKHTVLVIPNGYKQYMDLLPRSARDFIDTGRAAFQDGL
ncbi:hypothetical protein QCA50_008668 [Cerrena zonata]|uniref:F-box domain-containing protein n=1 Tax=Cerrena zonata TaxID=2478898 RepID=A0AAW0G7A5_9APHY